MCIRRQGFRLLILFLFYESQNLRNDLFSYFIGFTYYRSRCHGVRTLCIRLPGIQNTGCQDNYFIFLRFVIDFLNSPSPRYRDRRSGDIGCCIRSQKCDHTGNFLCFAHAAQRRVIENGLPIFIGHKCFDGRRAG